MVPKSQRLRRSELAVPATSTKMIAKGAASDADLVFLDLEDSVAASAKSRARANVVAGLTELDWNGKIRACRVNAVGSPWFYDDLHDVVTGAGANLDLVVLPKAMNARDVWFLDDSLTHLERKLGLEVGRIGIEVLIEEAQSLLNVDSIAAASPRLEALILGVGDLAASQGVPGAHIGAAPSTHGADSRAGDIWEYARQRVVVAARAHGLAPVDGPYADYQDAAGYSRSAATFASIGGVGKWCIHPSQVALANRAFSPSEDEIAQAETVVSLVRKAEADGLGAVGVDGVMLDAASARIFNQTLERARLCQAASSRNGTALAAPH
jgi:citrate lyase subunit beta/citryl-CoA lyase